VRLFVALDLPADVRTVLASWADAAAPPAVRRVPAVNLHVTLAFLGSRGEDEAVAVAGLLAAHARPVGSLQTADALWLAPRRPSVLTVALRADPALPALQGELAAALQGAIGLQAEARPFRPHVTVGRVARDTRIDARRALEPPPPQLSFRPPALTLYRSHSGSGGARYEALERVALGQLAR
jgi:2'-5' RNA ligase